MTGQELYSKKGYSTNTTNVKTSTRERTTRGRFSLQRVNEYSVRKISFRDIDRIPARLLTTFAAACYIKGAITKDSISALQSKYVDSNVANVTDYWEPTEKKNMNLP